MAKRMLIALNPHRTNAEHHESIGRLVALFNEAQDKQNAAYAARCKAAGLVHSEDWSVYGGGN